MNALKYLLLVLGSVAFFVSVYLSIRHPELVDSPEKPVESTAEGPADEPLPSSMRKWNQISTWVMWGGWGGAALVGFLMEVGVFEAPD